MIHWATILLVAVRTQAEIVACIIGDAMAGMGLLGIGGAEESGTEAAFRDRLYATVSMSMRQCEWVPQPCICGCC